MNWLSWPGVPHNKQQMGDFSVTPYGTRCFDMISQDLNYLEQV